MAKRNAKTEAQKYLDKLLAKVPEDKRTAVKEALTVDDTLEFLGEGVLAQEEFSRLAEEMKKATEEAQAKLDANKKWYNDNLPLLEKGARADVLEAELEKAKKKLEAVVASGGDADDLDTAGAKIEERLKGFVSAEQAKKLVEEAQKNILLTQQQWGIDLATTLTDLSAQHLHDYREPLNTRDLIAFAQKNQKSIVDAYGLMTADKAAARAEARAKEERDKLRKEIEAEVRKELKPEGHGLYPAPSNAEPSTLIGLKPKDSRGGSSGDSLVDQAAAMYQDLLTKRGVA